MMGVSERSARWTARDGCAPGREAILEVGVV